MSKPPRIPAVVVRKVVALPPALWERVNDWRHDRRIRTEVEGVRHLIERGLSAEAVTAALAARLMPGGTLSPEQAASVLEEIARLRALLAAAGLDPDKNDGGTT